MWIEKGSFFLLLQLGNKGVSRSCEENGESVSSAEFLPARDVVIGSPSVHWSEGLLSEMIHEHPPELLMTRL